MAAHLYIGGMPADTDGGTLIQFTYSREDMENPTTVQNSYSQSVTLPGTPANDDIFGHFRKSDRRTLLAPGFTGVTFDPIRRTPFELRDDLGRILESGYAKLEGMEGGSYHVTLYGNLGALLYSLDFKSTGEKMTLADLAYVDGGNTLDPATEPVLVDGSLAKFINRCWNYPSNFPATVLTFAPCLNGIPTENFDADKAVFTKYIGKDGNSPNRYNNLQAVDYVGADAYYAKSGSGMYNPVLLRMADKHTEGEMLDFRSYLQRPVVKMQKVVDAIVAKAATLGYTLSLSGDFWNSTEYKAIWMTLPLPSRTGVSVAADLLQSSPSPAEVLVGLVKTFGLVMQNDPFNKVVKVYDRNSYYGGLSASQSYPLKGRLDLSHTPVTAPVIADSKWFRLQAETKGVAAAHHERYYGSAYGSQKVNTGSEFSYQVKDLLKSYPFKGAVDVMSDRDTWNVHFYKDQNDVYTRVFNPAVGGKVVLYHAGSEHEFDPVPFEVNTVDDAMGWYASLQFHEDDHKPLDGANVLVYRYGQVTVDSDIHGIQPMCHLTDDDQATFDALNDGVPCWDLRPGNYFYSAPAFRRIGNMDGEQKTLDFGQPMEYWWQNVQATAPIYARFWKAYMEDRYDRDARTLTCWVNLSGLGNVQSVFRSLWLWDGAYWVLNKVMNYVPEGTGSTQCEFVKVKDISNYKTGQVI